MGALSQLVAVGLQDVYLTGDADHSYWRQQWARNKSFAVESIEQSIDGIPAYGGRVTASISRNGDLVTNLVLEITLKKSGDTFYPAEHLLKSLRLSIGGQVIDTMTNTWLRLYDELYRPVDTREAYAQMTDFDPTEPIGTIKRFYVPIPWWFSRGDDQTSSALPLIALRYHEVELQIEFEDSKNIPGIDASFQPKVSLWADYVFLDSEERSWFANNPHEYLIEQTFVYKQSIAVGTAPANHNVPLPFNHPVKYLAWVFKPSDVSHGIFSGSGQGLESMEVCGPLRQAGLQLNGVERFAQRMGSYFRLPHPMATFGQAPSVGVYAYSFALRPKSLVPSGTLNCSRVDSARLQLTTKAATVATVDDPSTETDTLTGSTALNVLEVYSRSYNVLKIASGMAGIAFAN